MYSIKAIFLDTIDSFKKLPFKKRLTYSIIAAILILYVIYDGSKNAMHDKSILVVTATAKNDDVPIYVTAIGNVVSEYTVMVNAQVSGVLTKVLFKEGQKVKAGDLLAQIDPASYVAQLEQAQGQFDRDTSSLENAKLDLARDEALLKQHVISKQVFDTQTALVNQYKGTVELDQGLVDNAKTNLAYCNIIAPIDGVIGLRQIDNGNLIEIASNPQIAIIHSIDPINVAFSIPQSELADVWKAFNKNSSLVVIAYDKDPNLPIVSGQLLAIDNQIDPTTGTVKLKAQFKNDNNLLFPNQFVNIKLILDILHDVVTVPVSAIHQGQANKFVYMVGQDNIVKIVHVETGMHKEKDIVVMSGVNKGDIVVTEGADKLTEGVKVRM